MFKKGSLGTVAGILAAAAISLSGKPYEKSLTETYFRKGFAVEGEDFLFSYAKAYGSKDGDCTLRLEDKLQIEDRGCDGKIESLYTGHMRVGHERDKEMETSLRKAYQAMSKYKKKIHFEDAKKRWERKRPTTLVEELPSYLSFMREEMAHRFWMYGFDVESSLGTSTEGTERRVVFHHDIIGKLDCELSPVGLPESPGIYLLDYDCDDDVDYVRDSVEVSGFRSLPPDVQKAVDDFYKRYTTEMKLHESYNAWEEFKKETLKGLEILDHHL